MRAENDNPLEAARELAKAHHLFIVDVRERFERDGIPRDVPAWVVYRRLPDGEKTRLGRRSNPAALLRFVRQLIGEPTAHAHS